MYSSEMTARTLSLETAKFAKTILLKEISVPPREIMAWQYRNLTFRFDVRYESNFVNHTRLLKLKTRVTRLTGNFNIRHCVCVCVCYNLGRIR